MVGVSVSHGHSKTVIFCVPCMQLHVVLYSKISAPNANDHGGKDVCCRTVSHPSGDKIGRGPRQSGLGVYFGVGVDDSYRTLTE